MSFKNDWFSQIIFAFLVFHFLTAKEFLVYNEETLVALCFFSFIFFLYRGIREEVANELENRAKLIEQEFESFLKTEKDIIESLIKSYVNQSQLLEQTQQVYKFTKEEITGLLKNKQQQLKSYVFQQILYKLNLIYVKEMQMISQIQAQFANLLYTQLLNDFSKLTAKQHNDAIEEALLNLENYK
nr:ATP synthase F0 subunit b [Microheliella maris]BDN85887.1 ATP synthase F0 subunit b [Microheliella maris]